MGDISIIQSKDDKISISAVKSVKNVKGNDKDLKNKIIDNIVIHAETTGKKLLSVLLQRII